MKDTYQDLAFLRRRVFSEVAKLAFEQRPIKDLRNLSYEILPGEVATYRDSIFKERAILEERIRLSMGLNVRNSSEYSVITDGMEDIDMKEVRFSEPLVNVIPFACEACPTKSFFVTNNCRKCLAHPCANVCPVNAITIEKSGAVIDKDKCIKCGRCKEACPYSAIVKYDRPCASVCGVNAIESDDMGRAKINHDKCVSCARCMTECPFGAISDKGQIYQLAKSIADGEKNYAIVAPSFVGQFGLAASPQQVTEAMKALGFRNVVEVALGADITTINEAKEYLHRVPNEIPFMATSCCNSWWMMVEKNFPEEFKYISDSASPMVYTAQYIKDKVPDAKITFVGPCVSKKIEAMRPDIKGLVDYVITFEECMGMMHAKGIEPSEMEVKSDIQYSSSLGRNYAVAAGVAGAVKATAEKLDPERDIKIVHASSLEECAKMMKIAKAGKYDGYLLEGMACPGGCCNGPGCMTNSPKVMKEFKKFVDEAEVFYPTENYNISE